MKEVVEGEDVIKQRDEEFGHQGKKCKGELEGELMPERGSLKLFLLDLVRGYPGL